MSEQPTPSSLSIKEVLEEALSSRAWVDPEFRAALQADPKSIVGPMLDRLSDEYGADALGDIDVHVHEETSSSVHLVISAPDAEEAELAEVSGFAFDAINSSQPSLSSHLRFHIPSVDTVNMLRRTTGQLAEPWAICWNTA